MKPDTHFYTSQFTLAVFLLSKNCQFVGIHPTNDIDRKEFIFLATEKMVQLVETFKYGSRDDPDLLVEVHAYEQARRELLDRLNDR